MARDMIDDPMTATLVQLEDRARDYHRRERALAWLADHWQDHPSLDEAAEAVGLSPFHFQRIFTRWAGVSPKTFVGAIAHAEARRSLEAGASVLDAALDAGLSGPSRLHDLFIAQEAVTPGEARRRGEGLTLRWGLAPTPFGRGLFAIAPRGLAGLGFAGEMALAAFGGAGGPVPLVLIGTPFHIQVWKALLRIPAGHTATYGEVAGWAGKPKAFQAAGAAIGANPVSLLIPCHRVIARDGRLTGYHWGLGRKAAMLGLEAVARAG